MKKEKGLVYKEVEKPSFILVTRRPNEEKMWLKSQNPGRKREKKLQLFATGKTEQEEAILATWE